MATNENLPPNVIKQLAKELKNLNETPPEGIKVGVNDDDFTTIFADVKGPAGTPYEHGVFRMKLILSNDFPHSPPKGYFLTKIFHPNIATNGEICVNTLKKDWSPTLGLRHVLLVIRCLLIEPFPESALNEQAGKMLLEDYEEYARLARLYTGIHAKPKLKLNQGAISELTTALNVDQKNPPAQIADQEKPLPSTSPPAHVAPPTTSSKGASGLDQPTLLVNEAVAVGPLTGPALAQAPAPAVLQKKDGMLKAHADKKKIDARKKSLKRL